ncbi:putative uncharacterized protein DDB_G0277255 isoform X8 [Drosophila sulfurigaster albostrigata]|uniref:putative uncharacterized protein DDB_G0277255 isoform X8 n=1 Tax=Drosophila sulfurigaster albostrigata TaxID=89887 RepID=UPI002D21B686|nr:putative uncharacterized protein DDB_G0277255 isoform X8 [Drosophila sulfurigaster albostrigata]
MSKKMWRKIFKSKPQKQQQQQLNKINKRHSRGIYEEYQQLNELLSGEQHKSQSLCSENEHEIENGKNGNINVFEQQPQQSSFNSAALLSEAQQEQQQLQQQQQQQQQQQSQQLSTFSRVRNTFSLRRSSNNNNNNSNNSNNGNKKQTPNPKSTTMESDPVDNDQIHEVNELESPGPITTGASIPVPEHAAVGDLSECPCCKRTFNPNALRKHVAFCGKKRKVFDSSRQRREGTALSTYVLPKNFGLPNAEKAAGLHTPPGVSRESSSIASGGSQQLPPTDAAASPASTRRKTNTDQARATARSSLKKAAGAAAESSGAAAAPSGLTRDRMRSSDRSISKRIKDTASERCPHCERSFNPKAFDRHVEWCKEKAIQANIKAANTVETNKAKERMEARKQYRPPNLKSDSNASSKTSQSSNRSYKSMNSFDENTQKSLDDSQKREIFISIETEANAQGHSPISPQSLRHMVGNAQTPIDVLHIENGNEPEHAKFSKISDTEEDHLDAEIEDDARHVHYSKRSVLSSIPAPTLPLPNVRANNAKNEIEKRLGEFKQIGEEFGDSVRRNVLQHQEHVQQVLKCNSHLSPSPSGDSDELSSLDGYPMSSSQSSRRGASSKLSSDSAYGSSSNSPISLSQRSGDKQLHISNAQRTQKQLRPHTAGGALASSSGKPASRSNKSDASTQAQTNYGTLKERQQLYAGIGPSDGQAGYSSSCSEISLPVAQPQQQQQQNSNFNYHQQQQHQHQHQQQSQVETAYNNNNNNNNNNYEHNAQNNMNNNTINAASTALASSQHSLSSNTSNGSSSMTASMKMSNYCYECGSKFMIGHAKFCVECGVKRVAL